MAHNKSAIKRIRQSATANERNKARRTRVRNAIKSVRTAIEDKNLEAARTEYGKLVPIVDKMVSLGILHRNVAARTKSRLNRHILSLTNQG